MKAKGLLALAVTTMLSGCSGEETVISPLFGVCAKLPADSAYVLDKRPPVDFDEGALKIADKELSVYIGNNPDFAKRNRLGAPADRAFVYVGKESNQGVGRVLFAQRGARKEEVLYVMFSGSGLTEEGHLKDVSLSTCDKMQ